MGVLGEFFNLVLIEPLTNLFVLLGGLTGNAGIAVILLTIIIRLVTLPLTLKQMHSTRMMSAVAPRVADLKKRYSDPRRQNQEMMRLYREAGINPLGCFSSMLLQMPILVALYQVFILAVGEAPEAMLKLSGRLYDWQYLRSALPLDADFLWLHLGRSDPFAIPLLVAATTYVLQKISMLPAMDERQRAQNSMMNMLMPLIFAWITISLPSGLGLYYVLSNLIGILMQYFYVGGGPFNWRALLGLSDEPVLPRAAAVRQRQIDSVERISHNDEDDSAQTPAKATRPRAPAGGAGRARRRNDGGRRRSRR